ncbi:hypothetical protein ACLHDF_26375 [Priestia aryabhattai]|uniref:hypothetical protein n=1 Tax=Priestia megaterium TaxID=1404 RepID=UPI0039B9372A
MIFTPINEGNAPEKTAGDKDPFDSIEELDTDREIINVPQHATGFHTPNPVADDQTGGRINSSIGLNQLGGFNRYEGNLNHTNLGNMNELNNIDSMTNMRNTINNLNSTRNTINNINSMRENMSIMNRYR